LVLEGRRNCEREDHIIVSLLNLGECLHLGHQYDESIELHEEALQELQARFGANHPGRFW
jgi:hypothetical protein